MNRQKLFVNLCLYLLVAWMGAVAFWVYDYGQGKIEAEPRPCKNQYGSEVICPE